jgi:hypothetical protein
MDSIAFANWLVVIRRLNASQRGRALQELALAEANLADLSADGAPGATAASGETETAPSVTRESAAEAASDQDLWQRFSMRLSRARSCLIGDLSPICNMLWISERQPTP